MPDVLVWVGVVMSEYETFIEIGVVVDYDFQPEEKTVMYPNDQAHPGCDAYVTINSVLVGRSDITGALTADDFELLADEIMTKLNDGE